MSNGILRIFVNKLLECEDECLKYLKDDDFKEYSDVVLDIYYNLGRATAILQAAKDKKDEENGTNGTK